LIKLFNTLSRSVEDFKPLEPGEVKLYTCGPTVYDLAHIGNLRAYVFSDLLKRTLIHDGLKVTQTMNITNLDDKTIRGGKGIKADFEALVKDFEAKFWADFSEINNLSPDTITRPTEYVEKMLIFIQKLIDKGFAYISDGSVYFSISKFPAYGKLSNLDLESLKSGARVAQDEYDKENPADFVLWKAWTPDDGEIFWEPSEWLGQDTKIGKGRPGWHIECSVMATDTLGETIDIHTGGIDLMFPHHENEIAQTEAATGKTFCNYWVHNEHLLVDGKKMAKSANNFYTLADIKAKGFSGLDFRYLCLAAQYRTKMNFTWEGLEGAKNARLRMTRLVQELKGVNTGSINHDYSVQFNLKTGNDLDSPGALAVTWELLRDTKVTPEDKLATILDMDQVLGLKLDESEASIELTAEQKKLVEDRENARKAGDFKLSDDIRQKLLDLGILIEDTKEGTKVMRK